MQTAQFTDLTPSSPAQTKETLDRGVKTKKIKSAWKRIVRGFWSYTEESGKADTKSFDGIL